MVDYNYYSGGYGSGDYSYGSSSSSSSSNKSTIGSSGYTSVDAIAKQSSSGLGAKTSSKLDQKGYTPTKSKSTASAKAYQANYGNDDDSPSSPSVVVQASSIATQQAGGSPHIQTKTANPISWYDSDAFNTPDKPVTAYVPPSPSEIESYVYNASKEMEKEQIDNLLAEAMGYSTPAAGLTIVEDRPLTAEERERFKPLLDMAKDRIVPSITTTELPSIQEMQQKEDEAIREAIKQIQNGVPLDQVLTNITDIAYRGEDEAPEETPVGDSFVGGEYQTAEIKPLTKEGILAKLGEVDPETGQPIQSAADVDSKQGLMSSPRPKLRPEGLGKDVGGFNKLNFKLNKSMNPAITMDKVYQNIGTKPGQVNPKAQENLEKMLTNQFTTLMNNVDFDIIINDAIVKPGSTRIPNPDKNKKGTPGSRHFHGDALDISTAGLSTKQLDKLLVESYKAGFRGFGFGNNILHIDLNAGKNSVRTWSYGNDYWANNKKYPVDDVMNRVRKGIE